MSTGSLEIVAFTNSSIYCFFRPDRLLLFFYALGDCGVGSTSGIIEGYEEVSGACLFFILRSRFPLIVSF